MAPREPLSDDLRRRFAAGEESAFAEVYRRYSGPMYAVALQAVGGRELAADVVQQAFLQAWRAAGSYSPDVDMGPWLFTITRRAAIDAYRRERRHSAVSWDDDVDPPVAGPSLESAWETWEVRRALGDLPAEERDVVRLAYHEGLTQSQTAQRLGVPLGTVKSRTQRAHRRLSGLLAHLVDDNGHETARLRPAEKRERGR